MHGNKNNYFGSEDENYLEHSEQGSNKGTISPRDISNKLRQNKNQKSGRSTRNK